MSCVWNRLVVESLSNHDDDGNKREFKIYDATVAKTSLKIASSIFSIYFAIMSVFHIWKLAELPRNWI